MEQNNVKEMTVKVMPRELGEIVIRLTVENGLMKANITANNKEAYNLLNSKAQELNNSLGNGEIKIQNFTIDIYNGDTTFFSRENSKEHRNNSNNNTKGKHEGIQALEDIKDNEELLAKELDSNVSAFV
nr:flagellar hook-length control protein FliK [Clostridium botulinum]